MPIRRRSQQLCNMRKTACTKTPAKAATTYKNRQSSLNAAKKKTPPLHPKSPNHESRTAKGWAVGTADIEDALGVEPPAQRRLGPGLAHHAVDQRAEQCLQGGPRHSGGGEFLRRRRKGLPYELTPQETRESLVGAPPPTGFPGFPSSPERLHHERRPALHGGGPGTAQTETSEPHVVLSQKVLLLVRFISERYCDESREPKSQAPLFNLFCSANMQMH